MKKAAPRICGTCAVSPPSCECQMTKTVASLKPRHYCHQRLSKHCVAVVVGRRWLQAGQLTPGCAQTGCQGLYAYESQDTWLICTCVRQIAGVEVVSCSVLATAQPTCRLPEQPGLPCVQLHRPGQLGPGGQQHSCLLHQRRRSVSGFGPCAQAQSKVARPGLA